MVNISGLPKNKVLRALALASKPAGLGIIHKMLRAEIDDNWAQKIIDTTISMGLDLSFDYLGGILLKVDITDDEFDPCLYDDFNGKGSAKRAIDDLITEILKYEYSL